jgi:hypothetical protein
MKFIDDAKDWWRFWSMRLLAIWTAAITTWPLLPEQQQLNILGLLGVTPEQLMGVAALSMFVSVASARVVKQP